MANVSKRQTEQHLIDRKGSDLFRSKLPEHWILREYRPDYGLDFVLETFKDGIQSNGVSVYETLGEHIFIQLKTVTNPKCSLYKIFGRFNVEKGPEKLKKSQLAAEIETYSFSLETSELVTVERMGVGVPVLLVIADLHAQRCSFVCLNDYIDKILIPRFPDYRRVKNRTLQVPVRNELGSLPGLIALRWYAKRPKLFAAFQRFTYQFSELQYAESKEHFLELARYFAQRLASYDFWDEVEMCPLMTYLGSHIRAFHTNGTLSLSGFSQGVPLVSQVFELWRSLSVIPNTYEDVYREWFLPTALGDATSAPP